MIKKLGTNGYDFTHLVLANKINEIIDHLPQEKVLCPKCDGGADKQPTKEVPNYCRCKDAHRPGQKCPFCTNIRPILEKLYNSYSSENTQWEDKHNIDQALQAISALYRKEKV